MSAAPRSSRRDFLQGKAAADALAELAAAGSPAMDEPFAGRGPAPADEAYLVHMSRQAMACKFEIIMNAGQHPLGNATGLVALDLIDQLEDQLSVYRSESEISRLNRLAAEGPVPLEPRLFELLVEAVEIFRATAGAYDITAAPLSNVWGFTRRQGSIPTDGMLHAARELVGSQYLLLDESAQSVAFAKRGVEINLGSIGKGYALDRCAELFQAAGIDNFLLHGGNSSVLACGGHGASGPDQAWLVGVRNPLYPQRRLGQLHVRNRALSTSGSGTQFFVHEGKRYGHILDPRTGWPAEGVLSVTVMTTTAARAEALSTAFYVMGSDETARFCQQAQDVTAIVLCPGARAGSIQRHTFNLAPSDWSEADDA